MTTTMNAIAKGLRALGVHGKVHPVWHDNYTIRVYLNNRDFGLWDVRKNTFVE